MKCAFESRAPLQGGADMTRAIPEKQPAGPECGGWADLAFAARPAVAPYQTDRSNESKLDQFNSDIVERINTSGRAYLTQTKLCGRTVMRIGLGNVLTTEEHLRKGWEIIQETASNV